MQSEGFSPQLGRQNPVELCRDASKRPGRNQNPPQETQTNTSHQNTSDCEGSKRLPTVHVPRLQTLSIGVRQESRRSYHLQDLPLRLPVRHWSKWSFLSTPLFTRFPKSTPTHADLVFFSMTVLFPLLPPPGSLRF